MARVDKADSEAEPTYPLRIVSNPLDVNQILAGAIGSSPGMGVMYLWIRSLASQLSASGETVKAKDLEIQGYQQVLRDIVKEQAELGVIIRDRLKRIEYAVQLRSKGSISPPPDDGI